MKPLGIRAAIEGVIDDVDDRGSAEMRQRCDSLAYIICTPPGKDVEEQQRYFSAIEAQVLELISSKVPSLTIHRH